MRLARLKCKVKTTEVEFIAAPSELVLTRYYSDDHTDEFTKVSTRFERHGYTLAMPLSEAVDEINAAMNYIGNTIVLGSGAEWTEKDD